MNRPRVTAQHSFDPRDQRALCSRHAYTTPGVEVSVSFDLHDHQVALNLLDVAVREVIKAQIEETRGDVIERNRAAIDEEIREAHTIVRRKETP
jgi:hypothetical protein